MPFSSAVPGTGLQGLLQGVQTGGNLFQQIMHPILDRERQKQAALLDAQHQKQLESHFQAQLGLSKEAARRAAQTASDQHKMALQKLDPNYAINQIQRKLEFINNLSAHQNNDSKGSQSAQQQYPDLHKMFMGQGSFPTDQETQESLPVEVPGQGSGMLSPQESTSQLPQEKQVEKKQSNSLPGGLNFEELKRALTYQALGLRAPANGRENAYTGPAREALDLSRLKKEFGENSEEYITAKAIEQSKVQQHNDLSQIRNRQLNGLKPGDTEIKNPDTGEVIGFKKQTTDKQKDVAKNTVLFNQLFPLVQSSALLSGPGATMRFENAARTYKTNPESKKIIDDLLIADRAAATTAVTEASRFNAGHTNQTFNRLVDTLKSEDIPRKLKKWIKEYEIPPEANLNADRRWQKELNRAEKLANSRIPATMDYYFDPEKQFSHEQEQLNADSNNSAPKRLKYNPETGRLE